MILPISRIKCKQWFYQYQQLNVNSDSKQIKYKQWFLPISAIKCKQVILPISTIKYKQWFQIPISTIKCKQWFYQYQQLNVNSDSTNINN